MVSCRWGVGHIFPPLSLSDVQALTAQEVLGIGYHDTTINKPRNWSDPQQLDTSVELASELG